VTRFAFAGSQPLLGQPGIRGQTPNAPTLYALRSDLHLGRDKASNAGRAPIYDCDAMAWHCLDCCQFPFRMHVWTGVVGKIERLMIDKVTGKVAYAIMSCGGILGIGADHHPIPWVLLRYNEKLGGYQVDITEQQLKNAPKLGQDESWGWSDRARDQDVYDYWR
jgi:PRC-barrel domain